MVSNNKFWKAGRFPHFQTDFFKLSPYEKWVVHHTIEGMTNQRNPIRGREHTTCDDCIPDMYLLGVVDDGLGNKGLVLQIHLDRQTNILTPISVTHVHRPQS